MRLFLIIATLNSLSACAVTSDLAAPTPECEAGQECYVKWRAAEQWIVNKGGRRIAEKTDTYMRSDLDQSPGNYLSIRVEKYRVGQGEYRIEATMYCAKKVGCDPSPWQATQDFNRYVNSVWKSPAASTDK